VKQLRLKRRDRRTLEVKARYLLDPDRERRRENFDVSIYFFFPEPFNMTRESFPREKLYEDMRLYLRFDTPRYKGPEELLDPDSVESPLVRLEKRVPQNERSRVFEARMLGCIVKSMLRDATREGRFDAEALSRFRDLLGRFHKLIDATDGEERRAGERSPWFQRRLRMADEHLSLLLERYAAEYLEAKGPSIEPDFRDRVLAGIREEADYRRSRGYPTVPKGEMDPSSGERYVYRQKVLKRWASEVLFFRVKRRRHGEAARNLLYAVAAGLAMVVATAIGFFGRTRFGDLTSSLFVLLVFGYILKDRMKDGFRALFSLSLGRLFFDRTERLYDRETGRKLAAVKERVYWSSEERLPEAISRLRARGSFERAVYDQIGETVLVYNKRIRVRAKRLRRLHRRTDGLADICVFNCEQLLANLNRKRIALPRVSEAGELSMQELRRVYHMNIVIDLEKPGQEQRYRFRAITDGVGILRVEEAGDGELVEDGIRR
jgi:hypothetical protein